MTRVCDICVMDETAHPISFNASGGCSYCEQAKRKLQYEYKPNSEGMSILDNVMEKLKRQGLGKDYDCLIGVSGGVDSSYLLHYLVTKYKVRPLVLHVDCGWNSEIAVHNIQLITEALKLDLYTEVLDWPTMRALQLAVFKSGVANADIPQDHAIAALMLKIAKRKNIKWLINGSNLASESILPHSWGHNALDPFQLKDIARKFGGVSLRKFPVVGYFEWKLFSKYIYKINVVKPLNLIPYDKALAIKILSEKYEWTPYGGKHHESVLTRFLQEVYFKEKFGFDKARAHYASLIVSKQISRIEALDCLNSNQITLNDRANIIRFISQKLRITEQELETILKNKEVSYTSYKNQDRFDRFFRKIKHGRWLK